MKQVVPGLVEGNMDQMFDGGEPGGVLGKHICRHGSRTILSGASGKPVPIPTDDNREWTQKTGGVEEISGSEFIHVDHGPDTEVQGPGGYPMGRSRTVLLSLYLIQVNPQGVQRWNM